MPPRTEPAIAATLRFSAADLLRCRFAISPAFETLSAIRLTLPAEAAGQHRRWLDEVADRVAGLDLRPIALLQPRRGYTPDFLAPPPIGALATFDDELARIAATPPEQVAAEIARSLRDTPGAADSEVGRRLPNRPGRGPGDADRAGPRGVARAGRTGLARVRALLEADVSFQTRRLAEGGLDRLFAELHPALRWHDNTLVRAYGDDDHRDLAGAGLVLMPSVFKWDQVVVVLDEPWQPTVIYPARGSGGLWQQSARHARRRPGPAHRAYPRSAVGRPDRTRDDEHARPPARARSCHGLGTPDGAARRRVRRRRTAPTRDPLPEVGTG